MSINSQENLTSTENNREDDEIFGIRHSISDYTLNNGIIASNNPEAAPDSNKQWFNSDLTPEGIVLAKESAVEFLNKLNPKTDALYFVSSDLVRAAETAKIFLDEARSRGFEIILPKEEKETDLKKYNNKAEEIGEGYIRKIDCLTLDHLENMLREFVFHPDDYMDKVKSLDNVSEETKAKWAEARKIIEADNQGTWGKNYAAHSEEIEKIFPNVKSAKTVYETKFKNMLRLIKFAQAKIEEQHPEKNIKVLAFSHENSFLYFLNKNFGESMKNCESIGFKVADDKILATAKGKTIEVKD